MSRLTALAVTFWLVIAAIQAKASSDDQPKADLSSVALAKEEATEGTSSGSTAG